MSRFAAVMVLVGLIRACRLAAWPTKRSPVFVKATMDGVVWFPSASGMTRGFFPSMKLTHDCVVPRSMPTITVAGSFAPALPLFSCGAVVDVGVELAGAVPDSRRTPTPLLNHFSAHLSFHWHWIPCGGPHGSRAASAESRVGCKNITYNRFEKLVKSLATMADEATTGAPEAAPEAAPPMLVVSDSADAIAEVKEDSAPGDAGAAEADQQNENQTGDENQPADGAAGEDPEATGATNIRVSVNDEPVQDGEEGDGNIEQDFAKHSNLSAAPSPYHGTGDTPIGGHAFDPSQYQEEQPVHISSEFNDAVAEMPEPADGEEGANEDLAEEEEEEVLAPLVAAVVEVSPEEAARRTALIEAILAAQQEKQLVEGRIGVAQSSVAEILKKKQKDDRREERDRGIENHGERYAKYLAAMSDMVRESQRLASEHAELTASMRASLAEQQQRVSAAAAAFEKLKLETAQAAVSQRTGRPLPLPQIKEMLAQEKSKEEAVAAARLEHLHLLHTLRNAEEVLREGEQLGEGLHLIDFEQLKLENQTFNEKIEERNEDVIKLRTKIANTVNVLSHVKEVLQDTEEENAELQTKLRTVESQAAQQRDVLSRIKRARDKIKEDNTRLRQQAGLAGDEVLLRDMESTVDEAADLRVHVESLRAQHAALQQQIKAATVRVPAKLTATTIRSSDGLFS
eukprot:m.47485 g.47485  ORF g.47485 m.47485 type:complete len:684 (-) comp11278_c0_seq2:30-2081(-)